MPETCLQRMVAKPQIGREPPFSKLLLCQKRAAENNEHSQALLTLVLFDDDAMPVAARMCGEERGGSCSVFSLLPKSASHRLAWRAASAEDRLFAVPLPSPPSCSSPLLLLTHSHLLRQAVYFFSPCLLPPPPPPPTNCSHRRSPVSVYLCHILFKLVRHALHRSPPRK